MEEQKQNCQMRSWKMYIDHNNPEAQSHENWSVLTLTMLSYFVLITTWIT